MGVIQVSRMCRLKKQPAVLFSNISFLNNCFELGPRCWKCHQCDFEKSALLSKISKVKTIDQQNWIIHTVCQLFINRQLGKRITNGDRIFCLLQRPASGPLGLKSLKFSCGSYLCGSSTKQFTVTQICPAQ